MTTDLSDRWQALGQRLGLDPAPDDLRELTRRHAEKHRAYHTMEHVEDCLTELDHYLRAPEPGADTDAVEAALWYHDVIYRPLRSDNESASARLAIQRLQSRGLGAARSALVQQLVLVTRHDREPVSLEERLIVDVDLSILGRTAERYEIYEATIRREYRRVPEALYRRRRRAALRSFLEREWIYSLEAFRRRYEAPARRNLKRALQNLQPA